MVRPASFDSNGMKKGVWSKEEDDKLRDFIERYGHSNWRLLPKFAGLARCGKSCRLRWVNYLKPGLKRGNFSKQERDLIIKLHAQLGNKWSTIASNLPGRTDNEVKNYWNAHIQKRSKRNKGGISKVIKTRTPKEKPSSSELINFSNIIAANQTETPLNNVYDQQGLSVQNLENNINTVDSAAQADRGNIVVTEEYYQTCYELPPFAEEAELDNIWLCQEMRNNNMSIFSESSDDGFSAIESQLRDFWAEPLGEEAISWYFGDIMDTLQD